MPEPLEVVLSYHERTKHRFDRYARSLGYMDWATQPDPFLRYEGTTLHELPILAEDDGPTYDSLFGAVSLPVQPLTTESISALLYDSVALSAWKEAGRNRWSLRVNPSSGNLHPTEVYVLVGPIAGVSDAPGLYHYAPLQHGLEHRAAWPVDEWNELSSLARDTWYVGLSSVVWREAWKYGERAFRYCQHDVGHALGALCVAAAMRGRSCRLVSGLGDDQLAGLLGIDEDEGPERQHPDVLVALPPIGSPVNERTFPCANRSLEFLGRASVLSPDHQPWPVIDDVSFATKRHGSMPFSGWVPQRATGENDRSVVARKLVRGRRSAVDMDGRTRVGARTFYRLISRTRPGNFITSCVPFAEVHLLLFVHRVDGLSPGLYLLVRNSEHETLLRETLDSRFSWERPDGCPDDLPLWRLHSADLRADARAVSCHQDIASDGVFCAAMLARFEPALREHGAWFYRALFWECGLIGQVLYLEAEAAGVRATGIGCFFDDVLHEAIGLKDRSFQSLYHFTVGGAVDDPRLRSIEAYRHLPRSVR